MIIIKKYLLEKPTISNKTNAMLYEVKKMFRFEGLFGKKNSAPLFRFADDTPRLFAVMYNVVDIG